MHSAHENAKDTARPPQCHKSHADDLILRAKGQAKVKPGVEPQDKLCAPECFEPWSNEILHSQVHHEGSQVELLKDKHQH